jgi:hypothetical protein
MLLPYGAFHSGKNYLQENVDSEVLKYTIHCLIVKVCLFFRTPASFSLERDEEEKSKPEESQQPSTLGYPEVFLNLTNSEPHKITQKEYSDLIRDLKLWKRKAELLSSRLQQLNLPDDTVKITAFRSRQYNFERVYKTQSELGACKIVEVLIATMNIRYGP